MAFILKGLSAEIEVPVVAVFSQFSKDEFSATVLRGSEKEFMDFIAKPADERGSDREILDNRLKRLNGLTDSDGNLIDGTGVLNWVTEKRLTEQEPLSEEELSAMAVIDLMMSDRIYKQALVNAVFEGMANRQLYIAQRLGN